MSNDLCLLFLMMNAIKNYEIDIYNEIKNRVFIRLDNKEKLTEKELSYLTKKNSYGFIKNINMYIKYKHFIPNITIDCRNNTFIKNDIFNFSKIENLILPKQINNLSSFCFNNSRIKNINLENILIINTGCFNNCFNLEKIKMPKGLLQLDNNIFANCVNLKKVIFPPESCLISIKSGAFNGCTKLTEINIPDSVSDIDIQSFCNTGLTEFIYPRSISHVHNDIFCHSDKIRSIKIPKKFMKINDQLTFLFFQKIIYY